MIHELLTRAKIPNRPVRFPRPLKKGEAMPAYAVYFDSVTSSGSDFSNLLRQHDATIELYSDKPPAEACKRLEHELDASAEWLLDGWERQETQWIEAEALYMTVYSFSYLERR